MTTGKEWLAALVEDVRLKNERVQLLWDNGEKAIDELRAAVEKDVAYINREIYRYDDALDISADKALSFSVTNTNTGDVARIALRPKDEVLVLDVTGMRQLDFSAESEETGDVYFKDSGSPISAEAISQLVVEPLVNSEYGLD